MWGCVLLSKCPSGQRCVELNSEFQRVCPVGETGSVSIDRSEYLESIRPKTPIPPRYI